MINYLPIQSYYSNYGGYGSYRRSLSSSKAPAYSARQQAAINRINASGRPYSASAVSNNSYRSYTVQDKALKNASDNLTASANKLTNVSYSDKSSLLNAVKSFADDYNAALDSASESSNKTVNSAINNMRATMNSASNPLSQYGVSVGSDGKLSVDDKKFMASELSSLKTNFNSPYTFAKAVSAQSSRIGNAAGSSNSDAAYAYNALANLAAAAGYGGYGYGGFGFSGLGSFGGYGSLGGFGSLLNSYYSGLI
ncbi:MAG: hypothetical protein IJ608_06825 [Lachnospiraceae bacterium]|nr:hypothetical protein [Lachnospiraceae bacterium]